jgi:hypothetical protein
MEDKVLEDITTVQYKGFAKIVATFLRCEPVEHTFSKLEFVNEYLYFSLFILLHYVLVLSLTISLLIINFIYFTGNKIIKYLDNKPS